MESVWGSLLSDDGFTWVVVLMLAALLFLPSDAAGLAVLALMFPLATKQSH